MRTFLLTFALALFAYTVNATPVVPVTTNIAASFPRSALTIFGSPPTGSTLPGRNFTNVQSQGEFPADILVCPGTACTNCSVFALEGRPLVTDCFGTTIFNSVAVFQSSNQGLPFSVLVGTPGCQQVTQVPAVNECFTVGGEIDAFNFRTGLLAGQVGRWVRISLILAMVGLRFGSELIVLVL
ncbi:hypothetical protein VTO73DRAFT_4696 [Trametes versicolor]